MTIDDLIAIHTVGRFTRRTPDPIRHFIFLDVESDFLARGLVINAE